MKKVALIIMLIFGFYIKEGVCQLFNIHNKLYDAISTGNVNAVKRLIQEDKLVVNMSYYGGMTPLHLAAVRGHTEVVKLLIEKGAKIDVKDNNGMTSLHLAAVRGHTEVVKLLIEKGAKIDVEDINGRTPLHIAVNGGHKEVIKLLIEKGANIKAEDDEGYTPLHLAAYKGHTEVANILIQSGSDVNAKNKLDKRAIDLAKNKEIKKLLMNPEVVIAQVKKPNLPPDLRILVQFVEPSGNNMLDGDEKGQFIITVENTGKGTAYDVYALIESEKNIKGLSWQNKVSLGDLSPGKKGTVYVDVIGGEELITDKAVFKITAVEANGFDTEPLKVVFNTKSFEPPKLIVADIGIGDQNGNLKIEPLEMIETTVRVQNAGYGDARDVVVDIEKGENVFIGGDSKTHFEIGNLKAGEFKDIKFLFYTNRRIKSGEKIPLKVKLSEVRKKFNAEHSLNFVMNAPQKSVTEVVIKGIETPKGQIEIATGLSVDVDINIPKGMMAGKDDVAVVIGNKNYTVRGVPHVEFADRDARIVREYLITTFGFNPMNVIYEEDATLSKFNEIFGTANNPTKSKLYNWIKKGVSRVFIYYTGHGAPDVETGNAYLMPVDADPQFISINGYNLETFYNSLAQLPAKEVIVVLDACFSGNSEGGSLLKNISPAMIKVKKAVTPPNATIIASAGVDQVSVWYREKKHSLFTYYFLKAIGGEADLDKDSRVTLKEIKEYLNEHVPYMSGRIRNVEQNPVILSANPDQMLVKLVR